MRDGPATVRRAGLHDVLAHERGARDPRRCMKLCGLACVWLALLGTASTVAGWHDPPARRPAASREDRSEGGDRVQPAHLGLELGTFVQVAGR
jgi:hypothetical protein